jgi:N-methylhydantoinase B
MTNTLNTPIEAIEATFPFRIAEYSVRAASGGAGLHPGGDGLRRTYEFLEAAEVTLMTERRQQAPWGLEGGGPGARGRNELIKAGGERVVLPAKASFGVQAGDRVVVETPGGGGWGTPR